jgi:hypothetical protein
LDDLLIRQKIEGMIQYGHVAIRQFPKSERHVLSQELRQTMWELLRLVITCNHRYHKKTTMQDLDATLDLLRSQIRLAKDLEFLPFKKYEVWSRLLDEVGRMIGGWYKSLRTGGPG